MKNAARRHQSPERNQIYSTICPIETKPRRRVTSRQPTNRNPAWKEGSVYTMGNVLAASSPAPPPTVSGPGSGLVSVPPGFTMPPVTGLVPPVQDRSAEEKCDQLPNPGTFEECHRKCKELFPIQMEGVKLTVNKGLSNHFQVNHTVALSTVGDSNYHFGATYVGTKQLSPTEVSRYNT
ncbi:mitochondrial import receptor subunit TOM40 homolog [Pantherophis guttatus]|uniref:Mitochondrial import receptor subunit TOM40 homolog n=1 Tax=Pantherophis guttatus TaxID=94885 RepID=A0A6P9DBH1_PANGU|nr:mitochondrial import receptor subunit TOM40 homolog [Pantherophis guttatus]